MRTNLFPVGVLFAAGSSTAILDVPGRIYTRSLDVPPDHIDFYASCANLTDDFEFFIDHNFTGSFELPKIEALPEFDAGYLLPELNDEDDRIEDQVTSISMPDLLNITSHGILLGYLNNLSSISFPKLKSITNDLAIIGSTQLHSVSLPSLETITGGVLLDGHWDTISLPKLKSVAYMKVESTGNLDCVALGKSLSSLTFTPGKYDTYVGLTCWTGYEDNSWNSSDPTTASASTSTSPSTSTSTAAKTSGSTSSSTVTGAGAVMSNKTVGLILISTVVALLMAF